jgi:hypothetical protein
MFYRLHSAERMTPTQFSGWKLRETSVRTEVKFGWAGTVAPPLHSISFTQELVAQGSNDTRDIRTIAHEQMEVEMRRVGVRTQST